MTPNPPRIHKPAAPPPLARQLTEQGDARLTRDPQSGRNRYGCLSMPGDSRPAFGSSTASSISAPAFAAAQLLQGRLNSGDPAAHTAEFDRLRGELAHFCGADGSPESGLIFAASGTDLHLIVAQLCGAGPTEVRAPLLVVMSETSETGNGVPAALAGRHYNILSPLGGGVIDGAAMGGCRGVELRMLANRDSDGHARPAAQLDAEADSLVADAVAAGRDVLLIVTDLSKTGLLAPSPACAWNLARHFPGRVDVLVDACQFRLAPETLRAYLDHGFLVALTGSKFVTGPAFSGLLMVPPALAKEWKQRPLPPSLRAYSARADWPKGWAGRESMNPQANLGLLLRWEAALTELKAFRTLQPAAIESFVRAFAGAAQARLASDASFEPLDLGVLDRAPVAAPSWDSVPTLFPFLLKRSGAALGRLQTEAVYKAVLERHGQIGQPARCGLRDGVELGALRLCASMRLAVDALAPGGRGGDAVIADALGLLDHIAALTRGV